jgi:hypothetical protein
MGLATKDGRAYVATCVAADEATAATSLLYFLYTGGTEPSAERHACQTPKECHQSIFGTGIGGLWAMVENCIECYGNKHYASHHEETSDFFVRICFDRVMWQAVCE